MKEKRLPATAAATQVSIQSFLFLFIHNFFVVVESER
jgi:hypothetical protein